MCFGLMTALFLIGRDKPTARDWLYFILGGIVIYQFRALVRYIVAVPAVTIVSFIGVIGLNIRINAGTVG